MYDNSKMGGRNRKSAGMGGSMLNTDGNRDKLRGTSRRSAMPQARVGCSPPLHNVPLIYIQQKPLCRGNSSQSNSTLSTWLTCPIPSPLCLRPSSTSPQSLHRMVHPFSSAGRSCPVSQPHHRRAQAVQVSYSWVASPT